MDFILADDRDKEGTLNKSVPRGPACVLHDKLAHAAMYINNVCYAAANIIST